MLLGRYPVSLNDILSGDPLRFVDIKHDSEGLERLASVLKVARSPAHVLALPAPTQIMGARAAGKQESAPNNNLQEETKA